MLRLTLCKENAPNPCGNERTDGLGGQVCTAAGEDPRHLVGPLHHNAGDGGYQLDDCGYQAPGVVGFSKRLEKPVALPPEASGCAGGCIYF